MLQLVQNYLNAINNEGPDGLKSVMTPDFQIKIAPKSLGLPPPDSLDAYIALLKGTHQATGTKNLKFFLVEGFEPYVISNRNGHTSSPPFLPLPLLHTLL